MKNELQTRFDALTQDLKNQQAKVTRLEREHFRRLHSLSRMPSRQRAAVKLAFNDADHCAGRLFAARTALEAIETRLILLLGDSFQQHEAYSTTTHGRRPVAQSHFLVTRPTKQPASH